MDGPAVGTWEETPAGPNPYALNPANPVPAATTAIPPSVVTAMRVGGATPAIDPISPASSRPGRIQHAAPRFGRRLAPPRRRRDDGPRRPSGKWEHDAAGYQLAVCDLTERQVQINGNSCRWCLIDHPVDPLSLSANAWRRLRTPARMRM